MTSHAFLVAAMAAAFALAGAGTLAAQAGDAADADAPSPLRGIHTHGPASVEGVLPAEAYLALARIVLPDPSGDDRWFACAEDDSQGRFQLVYAHPRDTLDFHSLFAPIIREQFEAASLIVFQNSLSPGWPGVEGEPYESEPMRLRVQCDAAKQPTVLGFRLERSTTAGTDFDTIEDELVDRGLDRQNTKYVVFYDGRVACGCGGQGTVHHDDRLTHDNLNNRRAYAMIYLGNLPSSEYYGMVYPTVLHEIGHTMGAVQRSAPHSTEELHCWDGADVMCYDDGSDDSEKYSTDHCPPGSGNGQPSRSAADVSAGGTTLHAVVGRAVLGANPLDTLAPHHEPFDCGADDYFNPHPRLQEYLCYNWNLGSRYNRFVEFMGPERTPIQWDACY